MVSSGGVDSPLQEGHFETLRGKGAFACGLRQTMMKDGVYL